MERPRTQRSAHRSWGERRGGRSFRRIWAGLRAPRVGAPVPVGLGRGGWRAAESFSSLDLSLYLAGLGFRCPTDPRPVPCAPGNQGSRGQRSPPACRQISNRRTAHQCGGGGSLGGSSRKWAWFPPVAEPPPGSGIVRTGSDFQTPRLRAFRFSPELKNKGSRSHSGVRLCAISRTVAHLVLCPWNSPGKNTGVGAVPLSRGSS